MNKSVPMISIQNLFKEFKSGENVVEVLKGAELDIEERSTTAIMGASGVGKSTLLHIMGTIERPDKGKMLFQGKDVFAFDDEELAQFRNRSIGFIFQFHHLLPEFNALENVMMPALISRMKRSEAMAKAESVLDRVGLSGRLTHRVGELSGGEQQRVAIARSLVLQPAVLLADEPTGNLDTKNSRKIHELLLLLNKELGITLIVVTHSKELADLMERCVTLVDGKMERVTK
ncbi:MAG: ABC transporter ATP-binding protein [Pseudomonadota bacterium]